MLVILNYYNSFFYYSIMYIKKLFFIFLFLFGSFEFIFAANGVCGGADSSSFSEAPVSNLCNVGIHTGVLGAGPWSWNCLGETMFDSPSSCSASLAVAGVPGSCKSTHYGCFSDGGVSSKISGASAWTWTCLGTGGAGDASCSEVNPQPVTGVCGAASGSEYFSQPFVALCLDSAMPSVSGTGPWSWVCPGSGGGDSSAVCTANLANDDDGICASAVNGRNFYSLPASGLCDSLGGNSIPTLFGGVWDWDCFAVTIGDDVDCSANKKKIGVCDNVTVNECAVGTPGFFSANLTHNTWKCGGVNGGSFDYCSLPKPIVSALDSFQVEPNSIRHNSEYLKNGICTYDKSTGEVAISFNTKNSLISIYDEFKLFIDGGYADISKPNDGSNFYSFRKYIGSVSNIEVKAVSSFVGNKKLLKCTLMESWDYNSDLDLFEEDVQGDFFYRFDDRLENNFFELNKEGHLFFRDNSYFNSKINGFDSSLNSVALNLHNIYEIDSSLDGLIKLVETENLINKHKLVVTSNLGVGSDCFDGVYSRYDYSNDPAFRKGNNKNDNLDYGNTREGTDLSRCDNIDSEKLKSEIRISLTNITRDLVVYQILPKYLVDSVDAIKFVNDGGGQRFIKDKDPIIGWYFNDTIEDGEIVLELPGNTSGGTFILAEEPILFNDGEIIINYRTNGCNAGEINLFDVVSLDGSKIYEAGTSFYKVCMTHLTEELELGVGVNDNYFGNYILNGNYSLDGSLFGTSLNVNVNNTNFFWSVIISDSNPDGSFSCLGSVENLSNSLFGDCLFNESNRIWVHLGDDLLPPMTSLSTLYLSHNVPVVLDSVDNLHGSGVSKIYYCVDESGSCDPLSGSVINSNSGKFYVTCSNLNGCIKYVSFLAEDVAGNYEEVQVESIKMIDAGTSCHSDCTVKPEPGRYVAECNGLNLCTFYQYDFMGLFDGGNYVASQCDLAVADSSVKFNSTHDIKCPTGPIYETKFVDDLLDLSYSVCNNLHFQDFPVLIDGRSVLMKVYSCLD